MCSCGGGIWHMGGQGRNCPTREKERVLEGMGLIVLHSGHYAKLFKAPWAPPVPLKWRES